MESVGGTPLSGDPCFVLGFRLGAEANDANLFVGNGEFGERQGAWTRTDYSSGQSVVDDCFRDNVDIDCVENGQFRNVATSYPVELRAVELISQPWAANAQERSQPEDIMEIVPFRWDWPTEEHCARGCDQFPVDDGNVRLVLVQRYIAEDDAVVCFAFTECHGLLSLCMGLVRTYIRWKVDGGGFFIRIFIVCERDGIT